MSRARGGPASVGPVPAYEPRPWWVALDAPCRGLFAADGEEARAVAAVAVGMGLRISRRDTDQAGVSYWEMDPERERLVADERHMAALMRAVRRSGLHGSYRMAGTEREYRF